MSSAKVVKQGWLLKRGEYIQNWRPRYFQLRSDGAFCGFKQEPAEDDSPVNVFNVGNSQMAPIEPEGKKGKFGFRMRFMQLTRMIERTFHTETCEDRDDWLASFQEVQSTLASSISAVDLAQRVRAMSFIEATPKPCDMTLDDFEMLKVLGKGTFGKVMLARRKGLPEVYAIKILKKDTVLEKGELVHTLTENSVLAKSNHPFLTSLKYSFQTNELLCFVMEYVNGGEVFYHLRKDGKFPEERVKFYIAEISVAMTYLHEQKVIYRDLKLENLLFDSEGHIKITDFGLCKQEVAFGTTTTTFCGTPEYLAPEVLQDSEYTRAVDWWGVGAVMYEMSTGSLPFSGENYEELFDNILHKELVLPPISPKGQDLVAKLLDKTPEKRLGNSPRDGLDVLEHPYFADMDLKKLNRRQVPPPWKPTVKSATDVSNFDPYFTQEAPRVSVSAQGQQPVTEPDEPFESFESVAKQ